MMTMMMMTMRYSSTWIRAGTCQRVLVLQDAPIHVDDYLIIIIIVVVIIITAHVLSPIPCFLLQSFLLLHLLPCILVSLGRESIHHHHGLVLWQRNRTVFED